MKVRRRFEIGAALVLAALASCIAAAEPAAPLRYRRVLVPEQEVDRVVRGLLPMRRDEFDRRIQLAQAAASDQHIPPVRIVSASYRARLQNDALIGGEAELAITHDASGPALLALDPMDLAIQGARWSAAGGRAAASGLDPAGRFVCLVEQSGTLSLSWSLQGRRDERGDLVFQLRLPQCPLQVLTLTMPADATLLAEGAIAQRVAPPAGGGSSATDAPREVAWKIASSGQGEVTLRVVPPGAPAPAESLVLVKERAAYTVERGAIDLETSLDLDVLHQPLRQLTLLCDAPLNVVSVRQGETRLNWNALANLDGARRVAVEFSPPLVGDADPVSVTAVASWDGRGVKQLPRIQVAGATWQEGQTTITADSSLGLQVTNHGGCRASGYVAASPLSPANSWQFQQLAPGASVAVTLPASAPAITVLSATSLDFGPTQIGGVFAAEVSASSGMHYTLAAEIPRAWIVDSVETQPADMLAERALTSLQSPPSGPATQLLKLSLRRPIVAGRSLRLVIRAHHRRPPNDEWLPEAFYALVRLQGIRDARDLVAWQVTDPAAQLSLAGDDRLLRLDQSALTPAELRLFESPPKGVLFAVDQAADTLRARLMRTSGSFRLDVAIEANVDRTMVHELWKLRCTPDETAIGRLVVHCRPPPSEPGEWQILGEDARDLTVRQVDSPGAAASESVFEITLARPRSTPLDITASFHRRRSEHQELTMVSAPAAAIQSGRVEVHAAPGVPLALAADGLQAAPLDDAVVRPGTLRGLYRYEPGRTARLSWHTPSAEQALPLGWVESLDLGSAYLADGTGQHEAVWKLRSVGQDRFDFRLPAGASSVQAQIGDQSALALVRQSANQFSVAVDPAGDSEVRIRFATRQSSVGWWGASVVQCPLPACDWPLLARSWHVQLPPGLVVARASHRIVTDAASGENNVETAPGARADDDWTRYAIALAPEESPSLYICSRASLVAWSLCLGLAAAAAVIRWSRGRWRTGVLAAGLIAAAWVLAPVELAVIPAGTLGGLALGAGWLLIAPGPAASRFSRGDSTARSTASFLRPTVGAGMVLAVAVAACRGQTAVPPAVAADQSLTRRVVIPVNDARQPVGDYVFLEPELYDALVAATERSSLPTPDWLLTAALYRPVISAAEDSAPLRIEELAAALDIETFREDSPVEFDFHRAEIRLVQNGAKLDGEPIVPEWSADGAKLRILVRTPGKHRLELALGVQPRSLGERQQLGLTIPRVANSRLELSVSAAPLAVTGQRGATTSSDAGQGRTLDLGATGQLTLQWPTAGSAVDAPLRTEADLLLLWKVRPGSVAVEGKLRVRPLGGKVRQILVDFDPRLRVLPAPVTGLVARQWVESVGTTSRLHVLLTEPAAAEVTVPLALLLAESSGVGNLALPRIGVQADRVNRSWSAVALAGNLEWNPAPTPLPGDPTSEQFAEAWGEPLAGPVIAFDASRPNGPTFHTEPSSPSIAALELLSCSVTGRSIGVEYMVELSGLATNVFEHELQVSPGLHVESVELLTGDAPTRCDWAQTVAGVLITQHQSPQPQQRLKLRANLPLTSGQRSATAPQVEYRAARERQSRVLIYRQPDVRLQVTADSKAWKPDDTAAIGQFQSGLGRLAAALDRLPSSPGDPPQIEIEPNQPEVSGSVLTRLVPGEGPWGVEIEAALEVEQGQLDTLRFVLPPALDHSFTVTPAVEHQVVTVPGQAAPWLVIRPQRALEQTARLSIRGRLRPGDSSALTLPVITLRGEPGVRHLAALPTRFAGQQYVWETSGLHALDAALLPAGLPPLPPGYELFDVVATQPTALGQVKSPSATPPEVQRADHRLQLAGDAWIRGTSQFAVLPRGARFVDFTVPPGCRLLSVALDGVPVLPVDRGGATWRLASLGGERVRHVDLDYVAAIDRSSGAPAPGSFQPPSIVAGSLGEVYWGFAPDGWSELNANFVRPPVPEVQSDNHRLAALLAIGVTAIAGWFIGGSESRGGWYVRLVPLAVGLGGAAWLAAGPWPALGWLAIGLALWLALRSPWPRRLDLPLSGVLGPGRLS